MRAEVGGLMNGEGGIIGADEAVFGGGSRVADEGLQVHEAALVGCVIGVDLPDQSRSKMGLRAVDGVDRAGDRALRKSV